MPPGTYRPPTPPTRRQAITLNRLTPDIRDAALANDATLSMLAKDPIDPMLSAEPTEPMLRIEFFEPIDSNEFCEAMLHLLDTMKL